MTLLIILSAFFGTLLTSFHGFLKAFTDRTLWGSDPNDNVPLILDELEWFQRWKTEKIILPWFKWVPIDAWHASDGIKINVGKTAGAFDALFVFLLYLSGVTVEWYWWILIFIGWQVWSFVIMSTTKWLFFEILFWKDRKAGFENWKSKWSK